MCRGSQCNAQPYVSTEVPFERVDPRLCDRAARAQACQEGARFRGCQTCAAEAAGDSRASAGRATRR